MPHTNSNANAAFVEQLKSVVLLLLSDERSLPADWHSEATTYDLPRFDSKAAFLTRFKAVVSRIAEEEIQDPKQLQSLLASCGLPYDYAPLGHPLSSVYELLLQAFSGAQEVLSFASAVMPFWAAIESRQNPQQPLHLYSPTLLPLTAALKAQLDHLHVVLHENHRGEIQPPEGALSLYVSPEKYNPAENRCADALCCPMEEGGVLFVFNAAFSQEKLQLLRKRTVAAALAFNCLRELKQLVGLTVEPLVQDLAPACDKALAEIYSGLSQTAYFCTGLAAEAAVFSASAERCSQKYPAQKTKLYYAQNAYGGTVQLIGEILGGRQLLTPCPLSVLEEDARGQTHTLVDHFVHALASHPGDALMLFLETPTNPELQVHDFEQLMTALRRYEAEHGITVPVLVDTTMAPLYPLFEKDFAQDWPFVIVKSGSKYFTRGKATLGVVMANGHPLAQAIVQEAKAYGQSYDSLAKTSQLQALHAGLADLEVRMGQIAENTQALVSHLKQEMQARNLPLLAYTMSPEQLDAGLATGMLSFYWPAAPTAEGVDLVDEFVDYMLEHAPTAVKNRVSYGQADDAAEFDPTYIINPQESTQGALPAEVKEAQKRDNVQICRISVPARCDLKTLKAAISGFIAYKYPNS